MKDESNVNLVISTILDKGINGIGKFSSAKDLANIYLKNKYEDHSYLRSDEKEKIIDSIINWTAAKGFSVGFITNVGGLITLPATIPAEMGASYILNVRLSASIAYIAGYDIYDERVETMILMTLLGDSMKDLMKKRYMIIWFRGVGNKYQYNSRKPRIVY